MRKLFILAIRFYQKFISPLFPRRCKYYPTCSAYALTAISRFGVIKGGFLAIRRILKCNPYSNGGVDKVPDCFSFREYFSNKWVRFVKKFKK